jgi:NAD(P)-dependent dehydrogenase (short-subunit alcohol dehydrogenase family)
MAPTREQVRNHFADKTVIVTGASSGIGRETALAFAEVGARVVVAARHEPKLRDLVEERPDLHDKFLIVPTDVTKDTDVDRLFATTITHFGRVDILVNNAGIGIRAPVADTKPEDARLLMEINFFGTLRCIQAALPHMRKQGSGQIVNVGSVLSVLATPRNGIYSASKFALRALSDALRLELHSTGIEVILIMPGYTDTPFFDNQIRYGGPARIAPIKGQHPRKVAQAILRACAWHKREVALTMSGRFGIWMKRFAPRLLDFGLRHTP